MGYGTQPLRLGKLAPVMLTDEQLQYELAACDAIMREATDWGPKMAEAEKRQAVINAEIRRRRT